MLTIEELQEQLPDIIPRDVEALLKSANEMREVLQACIATKFDLHAYKIRCKSNYGVYEKIHRKREELAKSSTPPSKSKLKTKYNLGTLGDVIGIRFITLFAEEQITIIERLLEFTLSNDSGNTFYGIEKDSLTEVKIYTNRRTEHDQIGLQIKSIVESEIQKRSLKVHVVHDSSKKAYSSVHFSFRTDNDVSLELQVRTAFEDAYGEIAHRVSYKKEKDLKNENYMSDQLHILKQTIDASISHCDLIYKQVKKTLNGTRNNVPPLFDNVGELLKSLELDESFIKTYTQLSEKFSEIKLSGEIGKNVKALGNDFNKLQDGYSSQENQLSVIKYFCDMGYADALISTRLDDDLVEGFEIYSSLAEEHPTNPLIFYRIARIQELQGTYDLAKENYRKAFELSAEILEKKRYKKLLVTKEQIELVYLHSPKLIGYCLWASFDTSADPNKDLSVLAEAIVYTEQGEKINEKVNPSETHSCLNNLLYFRALQLRHDKLTDSNKKITLETYDNFKESVKIRESNDERDWHTLAIAGHILEKPEQEVLLAANNVDKIIKEGIDTNFKLSKLHVKLLQSIHKIRNTYTN